VAPLVVFGATVGLVLFVRSRLLGAAVADLKLTTPAGLDVQVGGGRSVVANLLTQSNAQILYLAKLLVPVRLNIDYDVAIVSRLSDAWASIAFLAAATAAALVSAVRGARLFPLCVGWYWCFSIVTFVIPLNVVANDHRLYLPMIAVALLAGAALARVADLRGFAVAAAPLVCFAALVVQRSLEWRDDLTLWGIAVERAPRSARAHMHFGAAWHAQANESRDPRRRIELYDRALAEYRQSERLHPGWADLELNIGNASINRGRVTRDPADFEAAFAAFKGFGEIVGARAERPQMLQALALTELGRHDEAIAMIEELRARDPAKTTYYDRPLAHALRRKGDKAGAAAAMERVIAIEEPELKTDGLLDLAWWKFEDGDRPGAQALIQRALAVGDKNPREFRAYLWAARFLVLTGEPKAAEEMFLLARRHGWTAPEDEVRWVAGGRTPGVYVGTFVKSPATR
jgi:tetratricopeptide (TPR) repeat protein